MDGVAKNVAHFGVVVLGAKKIHGIESYIGIEAVIIAEDIQKHAFYVVVIDRALHAEGLLCAHLQFHLRRLATTRRHHADAGHLRAVHVYRSRSAIGKLRCEIGRTSCVTRSR